MDMGSVTNSNVSFHLHVYLIWFLYWPTEKFQQYSNKHTKLETMLSKGLFTPLLSSIYWIYELINWASFEYLLRRQCKGGAPILYKKDSQFRKSGKYRNTFTVLIMVTPLRPGHTVVQGQAVTYCESGTVSVWLSQVWRKDGCYTRDLHQGLETLITRLVVISTRVTIHFPRVTALAHSMFCLQTWMSILTCQHQQHRFACFQTLWSTLTHFIVAHSSCYIWQQIFDKPLLLSFLQTPKKSLLHTACLWCKPLVQQSSLRYIHLA